MGCGSGGGNFNQISNAIRPGARKVFCVKFQKEMEGLDEMPFEGHPLGQKIYDNVSKEAWKMWVEHMKMLMNEYRLNLGTKEAQEFLIEQMDKYFFGEGARCRPISSRLRRRAERLERGRDVGTAVPRATAAAPLPPPPATRRARK